MQPPTSTQVRSRSPLRRAPGAPLVAGIPISHPLRLVYAEIGVSKRQLAEYYADVAPHILPEIQGRPMSIVRCPRGAGERCFYQKHFPADDLPGTRPVDIEERSGQIGRYVTVTSAAGLARLVQLGALEFHHWGTTVERLEYPDRLVCDLDPGPGVGWERVRNAAREVRARLLKKRLVSFVRATGGKGLHVVVPLAPRHTWEQVRAFAQRLAETMQADSPTQFVATASKGDREDKIYVDYLRNSRGATAVMNYSTRVRTGAPVAAPLAWEELSRIPAADYYGFVNIRRRLARLKAGPVWLEFDQLRQHLPL